MISESDITEVQRLRLEPGDKLIVRIDRHDDLSNDDVADLKGRLRAHLGLADDFPVAVLGPGVSVELVNPS